MVKPQPPCTEGFLIHSSLDMKRPGAKDRALREHLLYLLRGGGAHVDFDNALARFPVALRGVQPSGLPHSAWSLLEHMRIAQWDILEFSRDPAHVSPEFPAGYWPASGAPPNARAWAASERAFQSDLKSMMALVASPSTNLLAPIAHGAGRT